MNLPAESRRRTRLPMTGIDQPVAMVTGAGSGIGRATAGRLAVDGGLRAGSGQPPHR